MTHLRSSRFGRNAAVVAIVAAATAGAVLTIGLFVFARSWGDCGRAPDHRFDAYHADSDAVSLQGAPAAAIDQQLGPATSSRFGPGWDRSYWLRSRGCLDGWYLVLNFDDQGLVREARVLPG
jgi:hypothetical protein